jgi:hypothetical protein
LFGSRAIAGVLYNELVIALSDYCEQATWLISRLHGNCRFVGHLPKTLIDLSGSTNNSLNIQCEALKDQDVTIKVHCDEKRQRPSSLGVPLPLFALFNHFKRIPGRNPEIGVT